VSFHPERRLRRRHNKRSIKRVLRTIPGWRVPRRAKSAAQRAYVVHDGERYVR